MEDRDQFNYLKSGFTSFFKRSIADNGMTGIRSLRGVRASKTELNLDETNVSGSLGDVINVGLVQIDGKTGRVNITTDQGEVTGYFGNRRGE